MKTGFTIKCNKCRTKISFEEILRESEKITILDKYHLIEITCKKCGNVVKEELEIW